MLFIEAVETARCVEEGVITSVADANIGSIMGIGFPAVDRRRAAVHQRLPGRATGFVARAQELADRYGDRFTPPASLVALVRRRRALHPVRPDAARVQRPGGRG